MGKLFKWILVFLAAIGIVIAALVYAPRFIKIDLRKDYIQAKISDMTGFDVKIQGDMTLTLFPRFALAVDSVEILGSQEDAAFMTIARLYIGVKSFSVLQGDFEINDIVVSGGKLDLPLYQTLGADSADAILSGNIFKQLMLRSTQITVSPTVVLEDVNMNIVSIAKKGLTAVGALTYNNIEFDDIKAKMSFTDSANYIITADVGYNHNKTSGGANLALSTVDGVFSLGGAVKIATPSIRAALDDLGIEYALPSIGLVSSKIDLSANITATEAKIALSKGTLRSAETIANWSAEIPLERSDNEKIVVAKDKASLAIEFSTAKLGKLAFVPAKQPLADIMKLFDDNGELLGVLQHINLRAGVKNLILPRGTAKNVSIVSAPLIANGVSTGLDIKKFLLQIGNEALDMSGRLTIWGGEKNFEANVKSVPSFELKSDLAKTVIINKFKGLAKASRGRIDISDFEAVVMGSKIGGRASFDSATKTYDLNIRSEMLDLAKMFGGNMDMAAIIDKLGSLDGTTTTLNGDFKAVSLGAGKYDALKLAAKFENGTLDISRLAFREGTQSNEIKGRLVGIAGGGASFDGFSYKISNSSPTSLHIPLVGGTFISKFITNGVKSVDIAISGDAANPDTSISASADGMNVKVSGKMLGDESGYTLDLSHNELKGFLYAFGFIDESLMDYFYDNIPFKFSAKIQGDNMSDIVVDVKDMTFTGSVAAKDISKVKEERNLETSADFSIKRLDLRKIIKRIPESEGFVDLGLKLVRALGVNLKMTAGEVMNYDNNVYKNLYLELGVTRNPGVIRFGMDKGARTVSLDSSITNSRIFDGTLAITNYEIPKDLMANGTIDLDSGSMDAQLKFTANGLNFYQILSSLSGTFTAKITDGTIRGVSSYDEIIDAVSLVANITTNNILFVLETAFKSGTLPFSTLSISGKIKESQVSGAAFTLEAENLDFSGTVSSNLVNRSLDVLAEVKMHNMSTEMLTLGYAANGFLNNMASKIDTSGLAGKINTSYLQKKKR